MKLPDGIIDGLENRVQLTDLHWNPFRNDELAVGLENGLVNIWRIPDNVKCIGHKEESPIFDAKKLNSTKEAIISTDKKLAELEPFKVLKVDGMGVKVTQVRLVY